MAENYEPVMRAYEPTVWDRLAQRMMGEGRASPEKRRLIEGLLGTSGLGDTGDMSIRGLAVPETAGDVALMMTGPVGKAAGRGAAKAAGAVAGGLLGSETEEAQAGVAGGGRRGSRNIVHRMTGSNPRAVIGGNNPPPGQTMPAVTDAQGFAIKGSDYSKRSKEVLDELKDMPAGTGPIDLSQPAAGQTPQASLMRYNPPRGVSARMQRALDNPELIDGIRESIRRGQDLGADKWYHTDNIRDEFIKTLGPVDGPREFTRYMDYAAGTSPRSDVSSNIRNASYYYMMDGKELPASLPYPYGHMAQKLHRQNAETIQNGGFDIYRNPKPSSFSENLQGNLAPVTVDTHAFRNIAIRTRDPEFLETSLSVPYKGAGKAADDLDEEQKALLTMAQKYGEISADGKKVVFRPRKLLEDGRLTMDEAVKIPSFWAAKPNDNEYAAAEQLYKRLADEFGMAPADVQAAAWSGAGDITGLKSPATKTFPQLFNERVQYTSMMRGEDPQDTLRQMILKQKPLLSVAPAAAALPALLDAPMPFTEEKPVTWGLM